METPIDLGQISDKAHCLLLEKAQQDVVAYLSPEQMRRIRELVVYVVFGAGTTAGSVVVETAPERNFAGTWANLATLNWSAASKVSKAALTGTYLWVRVRIATTIADGTADVYATGN